MKLLAFAASLRTASLNRKLIGQAAAVLRNTTKIEIPLQTIGAHVYPDMFGLPRAHQAFDPSGAFVDAHQFSRLQALLQAYIIFVGRLVPR